MISTPRPCPCGSGEPSEWNYDARGIPLARTCNACHTVKMNAFRPEVRTDPNYWVDELIDED